VWLRLVHLLVEIRTGRLEPPGVAEHFAWLLPFHQLVAGPIERFPAFSEKLAAALPPLTFDATLHAFGRITDGLVKKLVLAELIKRAAGFAFERSGPALWLEVDLQALYVYLDFSGYMDIVIGVGMLVGWVPPENFDWPYLSRNIVVFWTRWHMTLSEWIRDHVFVPLNLRLQRGALGASPLATGVVCYLVAMTFCGLWHQTTPSFALWGLLHGVAIGVFKCFEALHKRSVSKSALRSWRGSRAAAVACGFLTFQFVAVSFLFAFRPFAEALRITGRLL
jgi:D-alanyl-lipoteichoic acid acyltransferase DltB (MBOAT superfamily)